MINILLVENNSPFFDDYEKLLVQNGFYVVKAKDYYEAYEDISNMIFEVIVCDVKSFTNKHIEFFKAIREKTYAQVVALSSCADEEIVVNVFESGVDDFQKKPYSPKMLLHKIKAILRRNEFISQHSLTVGPFVFDYMNSICYFENKPLDLTKIEYRIIFHLAKNSNHIVSKQDLYRLVWEADLNNHSDALWAAISRLKKKIEPYQNDFCIDSNRNGYQLYIRK